jgi:hypothetical protein
VDFDFFRSREKKDEDDGLFGTAGLVGAVEVGVGGFESELREFEREGEELRESER